MHSSPCLQCIATSQVAFVYKQNFLFEPKIVMKVLTMQAQVESTNAQV